MVNIPGVEQEDIDHWSALILSDVPELEAMIRSGDDGHGERLYNLEECYRNQAVLAYLANDPSKYHEFMKRASQIYLKLLRLFQGPARIHADWVMIQDSVFDLILSGNQDDLKEASLFIDDIQLPEYLVDEYGSFIVKAVSCIVMGKMDMANSHINEALGEASANHWGDGALRMLQCIANRTMDSFADAWSTAFAEFEGMAKGEFAGRPLSVLFFEGMAYLRLNYLVNGVQFKPHIIDPRVPLDLVYF